MILIYLKTVTLLIVYAMHLQKGSSRRALPEWLVSRLSTSQPLYIYTYIACFLYWTFRLFPIENDTDLCRESDVL